MKPHFLDLAHPAFSTRSPAVEKAREAHWCARTPFGRAVLRHREAGMLLRDRRLRQGSHAWPAHTGLTGSFADFWVASVISKEGAEHRHLRSLVQSALAHDHLTRLTPQFDAIAHDLLDKMAPAAEVDFMDAFAMPFAGRAIAALLGLPDADWQRVANDAATLGLAMGVDAKRHEAKVNAACDRLFDLAAELIGNADAQPDGFVARLLRADQAATGRVAEAALLNLIVISIFGGVDTTRSQLGNGMTLFIANPDQWQHLRRNPDLIPQAIDEMIRSFPTTTWATREALETFDFGGEVIKAGETLHILVNATARDPLTGTDAAFDVTVRRKAHFGFGGGGHHCLGAAAARTDMASALRALAARVSGIAHAAPPVFLPDSGNTSPVHLPLRLSFD